MIRPALLLLCLPALAWAEVDWGGKLWGNQLQKTKTYLEDETQTNGGLFLKSKTKYDDLSLRFEGIGYYVKTPLLLVPEKDLDAGEAIFELNELNVGYDFGDWNIRAGQMTTSWGKADGLNPTDFLTGKRNILLVTDDQLTRRGHLSGVVQWTPEGGASAWSVEQWVVGLHSRTDALLNEELTNGVVSLEAPEQQKRMEFASRLAYAGQGWEFDYTYFNGVSKLPLFVEHSRTLVPFSFRLTPTYARQQGHGVNLVSDFEDFVVRLEAAYIYRTQVFDDADYIRDPSRYDFVGGIEKSFEDEHRLNVQAVVHHYPSYDVAPSADQVTAGIQKLNCFVLAQHLQTRVGYLLVYLYEPTEYNQFKFKLTWLNYFHQESSSLLTPQFDYLVTDNLQVQLYGLIFSGSDNAPLGALRDLSSAGIGGSYQF